MMRAGTISPPVLFCVCLLLFSCSKDSKKSLPPNAPPRTYLSVQARLPGGIDYRVNLHWWGADRDGQIKGYYIRWSGDWKRPAGAPRWSEDTTWIFTEATADTFPTHTGPAPGTDSIAAAVDTFQVRAVDNESLVDPVGQTQVFDVRNWVPTLRWDPKILPPRGTSICVVSVGVIPQDGNGRRTVGLRYWLDGVDPARSWETPDSIIVLSPAEFDGRYGQRTLFVQAVDDGGATSHDTLQATWTVEAPPGKRFLLIDSVNDRVPGRLVEDNFYRAMMQGVAGDDFYVLDLQQRPAFRTSGDVYGFLSLFSGAVWYSGLPQEPYDTDFRTALSVAQDGIGEYLDAGGRLLLVATNAVGKGGGLTQAFAEDRLGLNAFFTRVDPKSDVSYPFVLSRGDTLQTFLSGSDSLVAIDFGPSQANYMDPWRQTVSLFSVPPGALEPWIVFTDQGPDTIDAQPDQAEIPASLGVLSVRQSSRFAVLSFLLSRANLLGNRDAVGLEVFRKVLTEP